MRDWQKELDELREKMAQRQDDIAVYENLSLQEKKCKQEVDSRMTKWAREERDVEKLEKLTWSSVLASLRGNKEEDLRREKAEAYAAQLQLQEAKRQLEEIRSEIRMRQERICMSAGCERQYEELLLEKAAEVRKNDPVLAEKLKDVELRELGLTSRRKEIMEALSVGQMALAHIQEAMNDLYSAGNWGTWDILGGGLIADAMKYSSMDEAQKKMELVQSDLRRYQAELADVAHTATFDLQPDGFLQFADFFWDNIFADFAVRDKIYQAQDQVQDLKIQISQIQTELERKLKETEQGLTALQSEKKELIRNA